MSSGIHTVHTSLVGESPEITASALLQTEGERDSDFLFEWLKLHRFLWMLDPPYDKALREIVGSSVELELTFKLVKWRKQEGHGEVIEAPKVEESRQAFVRLERLFNAHFFDRSKKNEA